MRALVINSGTEVSVRRVLEFAERPENYYVIGPGGFSFQRRPGDDPRHVALIPVGFRAVFSITHSPDGILYRHLSISVTGNKMPNPFAAYTIAELFRFKGWDGKSEIPPASWGLSVDKESNRIVLATPLTEAAKG